MKAKLLIGLLMSSVFLAGCASSPTQVDDSRECVRNFTSEEGLKNFRTTVKIIGVDKKLAIDRLVRKLGRTGFSVNKSDVNEGFVSALFDAGDADLQLTSFFEQSGGDTQVEMNYKAVGASLGMLFVSADSYRDELCGFAAAMQSNQQDNSNQQSRAKQVKPTTSNSAEITVGKDMIQKVQQKLKDLGYQPGSADGLMGNKTKVALKKYQEDKGLVSSGEIDQVTLNALAIN